MALVLIDTNILIDYLRGDPLAYSALSGHQDAAISIITWIEVLAGLPDDIAEAMKATLSQFLIVDCGMGPVANQSVSIRRASLIAGQKKLRLPDAIILATAIVHSRVLLTRNTKDFKPGPHVVVPYSL